MAMKTAIDQTEALHYKLQMMGRAPGRLNKCVLQQ